MYYQGYVRTPYGDEVVEEGPDLTAIARAARRCFRDHDRPICVHVRAMCGEDCDRPHRGRAEARIWVMGPWLVVGGSGCVASALCGALDAACETYCTLS